ncbi:MAG TPA: hypothetical protein VHY84_24445 [Bryobacteraceae bacterium]|jgi:hypothetical protein|nr:hypothetical protein [Bryobacteraceae bacterium]
MMDKTNERLRAKIQSRQSGYDDAEIVHREFARGRQTLWGVALVSERNRGGNA